MKTKFVRRLLGLNVPRLEIASPVTTDEVADVEEVLNVAGPTIAAGGVHGVVQASVVSDVFQRVKFFLKDDKIKTG